MLNLTVLYLIFSILISSLIACYAWRNPQGRATKSFALAVFTSILWMGGDVIERLNATLGGQWAGQSLCFLGVCLLPVAVLNFIYEYCGKHISRRSATLLLVIPAISWLMMVTNPLHFLFYRQIEFIPFAPAQTVYGTYFWTIHLPYSYILFIVGFATVLTARQKAAPHYRPQISILFFSLCIPLAINVLGVFDLLGEAAYTSLSFPVFFSVMSIAVFRYRFLKSSPIAYETVFQTIRDGVIVLDLTNVITDINPAAAKSLGKKPKQVIGKTVDETFAAWQDLIDKYRAALDSLDFNDEIEINFAGKKRFIAVNVTPLRNHRGTLDGRIFTMRDVTARKQYESSLETMAFYDPLTRLANRRRFEEESAKALAASAVTGENVALLYFDLNRFKTINDTMGHHVGDELLKHVARRAASVLRQNDLMARLGGDEFAALLLDCDRESIAATVDRILENVEQPFKVGEHILTASLSIGAAFYPEDGANVAELLHHADTAMYQAKSQGGGLALLELPTELNM